MSQRDIEGIDGLLTTKLGKCLDVMTFGKGGLKLQVVERQNKAHNVRIFHETEGQMAFCFKYGKTYYHLKVNDKQQLELENGQGEKPDTSVKQYWFKRQNVVSGDHYVLCTTTSTVQYLSASEDSVTLHSENFVLVTVEA